MSSANDDWQALQRVAPAIRAYKADPTQPVPLWAAVREIDTLLADLIHRVEILEQQHAVQEKHHLD